MSERENDVAATDKDDSEQQHDNDTTRFQSLCTRKVLMVTLLLAMVQFAYVMYDRQHIPTSAQDETLKSTTVFVQTTTTGANNQTTMEYYGLQPHNYTCLLVHGGGFGNVMLSFLFRMMESTMYHDQPFPCAFGYGNLFSQLFWEVPECIPGTFRRDDCSGTNPNTISTTTVREMIPLVPANFNKFPLLKKLNASFIADVLGRGALPTKTLSSEYCAAHVRFGDFFFRENAHDQRLKNVDEACSNPTDTKFSMPTCFEHMQRRIFESCANFTAPHIYVATDLGNFTRYLCAQPNMTLMSSCDEESIRIREKHTKDLELFDDNGQPVPSLVAVLVDWLSLVLSTKLVRIGESTFSFSASLGFQVVEP